MPLSQGIRCGKGGIGNSVIPTVHVYGDDLPVLCRLDLRADIPLVYLVAQAGDLFTGTSWSLLSTVSCVGVSASRIYPPSIVVLLRMSFYHSAKVWNNERKAVCSQANRTTGYEVHHKTTDIHPTIPDHNATP